MIDTDKYENHDMIRVAKALLIEDAPLILAEYKKLREEVKRLHEKCEKLEWIVRTQAELNKE